MADEKPIIVMLIPDPSERESEIKVLREYLKSRGVEADIRGIGDLDTRKKSNYQTALDFFQSMIDRGERPALFITDQTLGDYDLGTELLKRLRASKIVNKQDKRWPEGKTLPVAILSGSQVGTDEARTDTCTLMCSSACLHDELLDRDYAGRKKPVIERFKQFVDAALDIPPALRVAKRG